MTTSSPGIWEELRQALYTHYKRKQLNSGWVSNTCFEPHVGDSIFQVWAAKEKNLTVLFHYQFWICIKKQKALLQVQCYRWIRGRTHHHQSKRWLMLLNWGCICSSKRTLWYRYGWPCCERGETQARGKEQYHTGSYMGRGIKDYGPGADKTIQRQADYDSTKYFCNTSDAPFVVANHISIWYKEGAESMANSNGKYMLN